MTLQLTPLLDLLLIVIFAQYLEMRQTTTQAQAEQGSQQAQTEFQLSQSETEINRLKQVLLETQQRWNKTKDEKRQLENVNKELDRASQDAEQKVADLTAQQQAMHRAVADLFASSSEEIEEILQGDDTQQGENAFQQIEEMLEQSSARDWTQHLLSMEEVRKRCDLWSLYLDENGWVTFESNDIQKKFLIQDAEQFQSKMIDLFKSLPQTKGLVILLVSYGDAAYGNIDALVGSLSSLTLSLQNAASGQTRFEYAVLGFLPKTTTNSNKEDPES